MFDRDTTFTYEVGINESIHPDRTVRWRFREVDISDCRYGCKIYQDPISDVRVLAHNSTYGCRKTRVWTAENSNNFQPCNFQLNWEEFCQIDKRVPHEHIFEGYSE